MDLTALHAAIRTLVRHGNATVGQEGVATAQQAAFRALKRDLRQTGSDTTQIAPMARGTDWMISPPRMEAVQ